MGERSSPLPGDDRDQDSANTLFPGLTISPRDLPSAADSDYSTTRLMSPTSAPPVLAPHPMLWDRTQQQPAALSPSPAAAATLSSAALSSSAAVSGAVASGASASGGLYAQLPTDELLSETALVDGVERVLPATIEAAQDVDGHGHGDGDVDASYLSEIGHGSDDEHEGSDGSVEGESRAADLLMCSGTTGMREARCFDVFFFLAIPSKDLLSFRVLVSSFSFFFGSLLPLSCLCFSSFSLALFFPSFLVLPALAF